MKISKPECKHPHITPLLPRTISPHNTIDILWYLNMVTWPHGHRCSCCKMEELSDCNLMNMKTHIHTAILWRISINLIIISKSKCNNHHHTTLLSTTTWDYLSMCQFDIWWDLNVATMTTRSQVLMLFIDLIPTDYNLHIDTHSYCHTRNLFLRKDDFKI